LSGPPRERRNPFRREQDAFRILVIVAVAAVIVIAVAVAISTTAAALLGLVFVLLGGYFALRWLQYELGSPDPDE
jgi:hypothetical protein